MGTGRTATVRARPAASAVGAALGHVRLHPPPPWRGALRCPANRSTPVAATVHNEEACSSDRRGRGSTSSTGIPDHLPERERPASSHQDSACTTITLPPSPKLERLRSAFAQPSERRHGGGMPSKRWPVPSRPAVALQFANTGAGRGGDDVAEDVRVGVAQAVVDSRGRPRQGRTGPLPPRQGGRETSPGRGGRPSSSQARPDTASSGGGAPGRGPRAPPSPRRSPRDVLDERLVGLLAVPGAALAKVR